MVTLCVVPGRAHCFGAPYSKIVSGGTIYLVFLFSLKSSRRPLHLFTNMPLAVHGSHLTSFDEFPSSHRRNLHRRSSCPSIPRSVSTDSSVYGLFFSSKDPNAPTDSDDEGTYMSPLFRGLGGFGEVNGEEVERVSATSTGGFTPKAKAIDCDDSVFDCLADYQFDIIGLDHVWEPTEASKDKPSIEQSLTPAHPRSLRVPDKALNLKAPQPLPPSPDSPPGLPPPVPPKAIRPVLPLNTGTRPLQIDRSKKRTEPSSSSQRSLRADAQHAPPTSKPIMRATTQVNLREAYKRGSPLAERKVPTRRVPPTPRRPLPETPNENVAQVMYLISVLHRANSYHSTANPNLYAISDGSHSS